MSNPLDYPGAANEATRSQIGAAAAVSVTIPAPGIGRAVYVEGFIISGGGATAALEIDVSITGLATPATFLDFAVNIPAGAGVPFAPIVVMFPRPLKGAANGAVILNVPTPGAGNTGISCCLIARTGPDQP